MVDISVLQLVPLHHILSLIPLLAGAGFTGIVYEYSFKEHAQLPSNLRPRSRWSYTSYLNGLVAPTSGQNLVPPFYGTLSTDLQATNQYRALILPPRARARLVLQMYTGDAAPVANLMVVAYLAANDFSTSSPPKEPITLQLQSVALAVTSAPANYQYQTLDPLETSPGGVWWENSAQPPLGPPEGVGGWMLQISYSTTTSPAAGLQLAGALYLDGDDRDGLPYLLTVENPGTDAKLKATPLKVSRGAL